MNSDASDMHGGSDAPSSEDSETLDAHTIVNWVIGGLVVALLAVNLVNFLRPSPVEKLVDKPAPSLELRSLDPEGKVALESYRGEVVLLDFWATWCPPCRRQMKRLRALQTRDGVDADFQILSINTDAPKPGRASQVRQFLNQRGWDFTTLLDNGRAGRAYEVESLPTLVVVDPNGTVRYAGTGVHGTDELTSLIEKAAQH